VSGLALGIDFTEAAGSHAMDEIIAVSFSLCFFGRERFEKDSRRSRGEKK